MIDLRAIGVRIEAARKQAGYTQDELAEILEMSQPNLSRIENGASRLTLGHLAILQRVTGRPVSYFLGYSSDLTEDEQQLLAVYRRLPATGLFRRMAYHSVAALLLALVEPSEPDHNSVEPAESKSHY